MELSSPAPLEESQRILETVKTIPFENRDKIGFWSSLWSTWKLACLRPSQFFPSAGDSHDTGSALIFFIMTATLGAYGGYLLSLPLRLAVFIHFISVMSQGANAFPQLTTGLVILANVAWLFLIPVVLIFGLMFSALLTHLFLMLAGGASRGFGTTLRTLAYAGGANLIPGIGWIWSLVVGFIGLAKAHRTELWRVALASVVEFFVCLLLILIPLISFFTIVRNYQH